MTDIQNTFLNRYEERLADFTRVSRIAGSRSDYVQGGGGNTSCKLDNRLMAIKASGFRLDQIAPDDAYAVLDYSNLRAFYQNTDVTTLDDVEKAGSSQAKDAAVVIDGLPVLRPSVEAGFHSLLETYVLHTHPVYANLLTCAVEGPELAARIMKDMNLNYAFVPYINPGAQLTFEIDAARKKAADSQGKQPSVIFMQNHGLIATSDDADTCLDLHEKVNKAVAAFFGISEKDWPSVEVEPVSNAASANFWQSATPWLKARLLDTVWDLDFFTVHALYPDQLVFLSGQMEVVESGSLSEYKDISTRKAIIFRETGEVLYQCSKGEAGTIEETLCAILFIILTIRSAGYNVNTMNEAGKQFISNWESEQYRKTIAAK
ncbi:MAG: class II aldolase/adducin family protein [Eubacteriales bacterium]